MESNNTERIDQLEQRIGQIEERMEKVRARRKAYREAAEADGGRHEERRHHCGEGGAEGRRDRGRHGGGPWGRGGRRGGRRSIERLIAKANELDAAGIMSFAGLHRTGRGEGESIYQWGLRGITTDDVLHMDDARNIKVLAALAHPVRLRMMKSILQQPGTAAQLKERLQLSSNGQTYHALNLLENGGMIEQQSNGTYTAVGDKACGFLILLGGLFQLTEGEYSPAFLDIEIEDENESADDDVVADDEDPTTPIGS